MSRITSFTTSILLLCLAPTTFAGDCDNLAEGGSRWEACVISQDTKEIEIKLNKKYKEILNGYKVNGSVKERKMLIEAERAWVAFRTKTCEFENEAMGGINSVSWARCNYRLLKERLEYFESANF